MKRKANWITFEELAVIAGIKMNTLCNYLSREEFSMYTEFKRKGLSSLFYVCLNSTRLLANLLKSRQRYLPAKCIKNLGERYVFG
jgi:hypothetical protein